MSKQAFGQSEELQEEVMPLSNMYNNRLDNLVKSSNKEDVINYSLNKNTTSPQLLAIGKDKVAHHSELKERIKGAKRDTSDVNFLY